MSEGGALVLPRDRMHAVGCIGDQDSVASSIYLWMNGTAALDKVEYHAPSRQKARVRSPSPPPAWSSSLSVLSAVAKSEEVSPSSQRASVIARAAAATLRDFGAPHTAAAAMIGTSISTVQRWGKRAHKAGSVDDNPRSGWPRKTTTLDDAAIVRASKLNHRASNKAIRHQLHLPISEDPVGRRLDAAGLPSRTAANKIQYTDEERRKRLSFAYGYEHWTAEDWEKLIISDEVTIEDERRKRHQRVRRPPGHRFDPEYTVHTQIYAPSRHLFACFCSRGPGYCEMYEGKLDGKALKGLLDRTLLATARDYYQTDPLTL